MYNCKATDDDRAATIASIKALCESQMGEELLN